MKLFDVYPLFDVNINKGKDCYVYDDQNIEYLDLYGGHAVISIGHAQPHYVKTISNQVETLGFYSNFVTNKLQEQLADKLGKFSGYDEYSLFLINSGAEANENALKLASFKNGRTKVVSFKKSFHGRTDAAVQLTDNPNILAPINKNMEVLFLEWEDITAVEQTLKKQDVCALIIEGIQGVGGVHVASTPFLQAIRKLCTETGTVLIIDEIQSGYGRTGRFFAHQHADIKGDIISMAKGMGNGFPIGGILISPDFKAIHGQLGTTFGGNHLACAAAIAVLEVMEQDQLMENAAQVGTYLMSKLSTYPQIKEVRGVGLMIGLEFETPIASLRKKLIFEQHVLTGASGTHTLRLLPPLTLSISEADQFLAKLSTLLS